MIIKLLTEHHLEFLSLKGGCRGSSESTLVKMSNCWKSHAAVQFSEEERAGSLPYLYNVLLVSVACVSSQRCRGLVCSL